MIATRGNNELERQLINMPIFIFLVSFLYAFFLTFLSRKIIAKHGTQDEKIKNEFWMMILNF